MSSDARATSGLGLRRRQACAEFKQDSLSLSLSLYIYIYIYVYIYIYMYMCVYIYIYIYMYLYEGFDYNFTNYNVIQTKTLSFRETLDVHPSGKFVY